MADGDFDDDERPRKKTRKASATVTKTTRRPSGNVFAKIGMLALIAFIVAGMLTWVIAFSIEELPSIKGFIGRRNYSDLLFFVFLVAFVLVLSTSAWAFLSKEELTGQVHVKQFQKQEKKAWSEALAPPKLTPAQQAALERQKQRRLEEEQRLLAEENGAPSLDDVLNASLDMNPTVTAPAPAQAAPVSQGAMTPQGEKQKAQLMGFMSRGLEGVMQKRPKLDTFNKFGVNLYMAGAADALSQSSNLSDAEGEQIFVDSVAVLGTKPDQARQFLDKMNEYMSNPKYMGMIEQGREAMSAQMSGDGNASKKLEKALDGWNTREDKGGSSSTIAVMFTDIVGSTNMTQTHGDAAAQEVVRRHNRIVRAALTQYHGREVKHTGDGIMASFANVASAVEAGIYIQRKVNAENANAKIPLGLKIGINAGEPIVEDDDLFGTTVQLSARICDKASNYQILVSETVKGICQGKAISFTARGTREMKGFKEPIPLYEAMWQAAA